MKKLISLLICIVAIYIVTIPKDLGAQALRVLLPVQGGTGISTSSPTDIGKCIKVLSDSPFKYELASCGGIGGDPTIIQIDGTPQSVGTPTLNFTSNSFAVTENPADTFSLRVSTSTLGLLASSISDFVSTVRTSISETIEGLTYTSGTGVLSLDSGYTIPTTTRAVTWDNKGTGSVTSVDMSVPTGLTIAGNPITTTGTLALSLTSGYTIPSTTRMVNADTAFSWGNHASQGYITDGNTNWDNSYGYVTQGQTVGTTTAGVAGEMPYWTGIRTLGSVATGTLTENITGLNLSATRGLIGGSSILQIDAGYSLASTSDFTRINTAFASSTAINATTPLIYTGTTGNLSIQVGTGSQNGYISSTDWTSFNQKVSSTSIDSSLELANLIGDETGTGSIVLSASPTFTGGATFTGIRTTASSTLAYASSTALTVSGSTYLGSLSGLLKGTAGLVGTASNGTDYTLITGTTCSGSDKVSAISASGAVTCTADVSGGGGGGSISTSTIPTAGKLTYWTSASQLSDVATGTLTTTATGLELSATRGLVGGASILSLTSGYTIPTTTRATNWDTAFGWGNHGSAGYLTTVDMSANTNFGVTATGLEESGDNLALTAGYAIPTTTRLVNHDTAFSWGNHAGLYDSVTTAGDGLTRTVNDFDCDIASGSVFGCVSTTDWTTFMGKVASSSIDTLTELETLQGGINIVQSTEINSSSLLAGILTDETGSAGSGLAVFSNAPTFTGTTAFNSLTVAGTSTLGNATSTTLGVTTGINLFGGGLKTSANALCIQLTGSSDLCDGSDATGAGGSGSTLATTTADYVISTNGSTVYAWNASTTATEFSGEFSTVLQNVVNKLDGSAQGGRIYIRPGRYISTATTTIQGPAVVNEFPTTVSIQGAGQGATEIVVNGNTDFLHLTDVAMVNLSDFTVYLSGSGRGITSKGQTGGTRAFWLSSFKNLVFTSTTTSHTGFGMYLGNPFRSTFENIEFYETGNCAHFRAEDTTASYGAYNPGDFTFTRMFCDMNNTTAGTGIGFSSAGNYARINQASFDMVEIYGAGGVSNIGFDLSGQASHNTFTNVNVEQVGVFAKLRSNSATLQAQNNEITSNYIYVVTGGTVIDLDSNSIANEFDIGEWYNDGTVTLVKDANTNTSQRNTFNRLGLNNDGTILITNPATTTTVFRDIFGRNDGFSNATRTIAIGNFGIQGNVAIGTSTPEARLDVWGETSGKIITLFSNAGTKFMEMLNTGVTVLLGVWDFGGATSVEVPNGTANTVDTTGEIALDTTDDQLIMADGGGTARVFGTDEFRVVSLTMASSSLQFDSGDLLAVLGFKDGLEITQFRCYVVGGTSKVVNLTDGTNDTETITCGTTMTSDTDVATNDTFTADEIGSLEMGATTGTVNYLHFEAWARITRE